MSLGTQCLRGSMSRGSMSQLGAQCLRTQCRGAQCPGAQCRSTLSIPVFKQVSSIWYDCSPLRLDYNGYLKFGPFKIQKNFNTKHLLILNICRSHFKLFLILGFAQLCFLESVNFCLVSCLQFRVIAPPVTSLHSCPISVLHDLSRAVSQELQLIGVKID